MMVAPSFVPGLMNDSVAADDLTLRQIADQRGLAIGCEMTGGQLRDPGWKAVVAREFNLAVIDAGLYWKECEPARGQFDFSAADQQVQFARDNNMRVRLQPLVYATPSLLPDWLLSGDFGHDELIDILTNHVTGI